MLELIDLRLGGFAVLGVCLHPCFCLLNRLIVRVLLGPEFQKHPVDHAEVQLALAGEGFDRLCLQGADLFLRFLQLADRLLVGNLKNLRVSAAGSFDQLVRRNAAEVPENFVRVLCGDRVRVEYVPGSSRGRITYRYR